MIGERACGSATCWQMVRWCAAAGAPHAWLGLNGVNLSAGCAEAAGRGLCITSCDDSRCCAASHKLLWRSSVPQHRAEVALWHKAAHTMPWMLPEGVQKVASLRPARPVGQTLQLFHRLAVKLQAVSNLADRTLLCWPEASS